MTFPAVSRPVLRCAGCGTIADTRARGRWPWACPQRADGDDVDHVIVPQLDLAGVPLVTSESGNPFVRFRGRLSSYHLWRAEGRDDQSFISLVEELDADVAQVAGHGFRVTPLTHFPDLDNAVGSRVWVKDETGNVAGSHKGRHLFGVLLLLRVLEELGEGVAGDLAIASCGNAALAAAVLAAAGGRQLTAFVPVDADPGVVERLRALGARVERCPRDDQPGDPCYRRFRRAVAAGAIPFSCQGPDNGFAIEGASTLAWEVIEALPGGVDRVVLQVGGGALATACARGFAEPIDERPPVAPSAWPAAGPARSGHPVIDTVQTVGAHPLERALVRLREGIAGGMTVDEALDDAAHHRSRYMWPWETEPASIAGGILDDDTYDWLAVARAMLDTGGTALVAGEAVLEEANRLARSATGIEVDATGSAGLAGLLLLARRGDVPPGSDVLVLFTGGGAGKVSSPRTDNPSRQSA